jgi:hypothetical protein
MDQQKGTRVIFALASDAKGLPFCTIRQPKQKPEATDLSCGASRILAGPHSRPSLVGRANLQPCQALRPGSLASPNHRRPRAAPSHLERQATILIRPVSSRYAARGSTNASCRKLRPTIYPCKTNNYGSKNNIFASTNRINQSEQHVQHRNNQCTQYCTHKGP